MQKPSKPSGQKDDEDKNELELYLFDPSARDKMVAFKRFQPCSFPMRFLKKDQVLPLHSLGQVRPEDNPLPRLSRKQMFDEQLLAFVSRA